MLSLSIEIVIQGISVKAYLIKGEKHRLLLQVIVDKIEHLYRSCKTMVQHCFQMIQEKKQEKKQERIFQRKNQERIQRMNQERIQRMNQERKSCNNSCVSLLNKVIVIIITISCLPLFLSCLAIVLAVGITIVILYCLGKLILAALRSLVSMLSRCCETHLYQLKLMDEYARKVIHLICDESFSKLDEIQFVQSKAVEATFQAIKNGIPDIVKEIIKANANNELWCSKLDPEDPSRNIFACAIAHRQEEVAHLLYESQKEKNVLFSIDENGNNTLHLAAKLAPNYQTGYIYAAALQLQSELLFVREHKDLLKEAEEWVKKTAESSTVVGALIITIMFAVAFSVPGGNDANTGFPVLLHKTPTPFLAFMVSDAISLFTASSSVLMFLGILTSHHSDEDYRKTFLLIIGLTSLFVSIATMTTAFCTALFIMLQGQGRLGLVIPITLFAGIPIVCYVLLQFPLLVEILGLTFSSNIFGKKKISSMSRTADMVARGMRNLRG
ncbi:hypothetical protein SLEP1_g19062 [Rubroshorea leprosula]|nr:hypothetical protein SLEP1_g19062 [Rubroshorea leprosula]